MSPLLYLEPHEIDLTPPVVRRWVWSKFAVCAFSCRISMIEVSL